MRRHTVIRASCLLLTTFVLGGCGDDDDGSGPEGSWEGGCRIAEVCNSTQVGVVSAAVTGAVLEPVSGGAVLTEGTDGSWTVVMGVDHEGESGIFLAGADGRPAVGTYALDPGLAAVGASYLHGADANTFFAVDGELTVTQSSDAGVAGAFEFSASDAEGNAVAVEGTFNAPLDPGGTITIDAAPRRAAS